MSDATVCELVMAGVIVSDSLQLQSPATACELAIGGAIAQSVLDLTPASAGTGSSDHEGEQGDTGKASDLIQLSAALSLMTEEAASASDTLQAAVGITRQVDDTASASDSLQVSVHYQIELLETIAAAGSTQARQHGSVELLAAVFASDNVKHGDASVIYTARSDSLAMSALVPEAELNALAVMQGQLAASGVEGLYRFTGKPLAPFIQTGWRYPEGSALWRAESAYIQHSGEPLTLHLTVSDGDEQTYSYTSEPRTANTPVPSKVKLGRGIRARALRIGLSGKDFVLDSGELILNPLSRKH